MFRNLSPGFLLQAFTGVCLRFPGAMISAFTAAISLILIVNHHDGNDDLLRLWLTAQVGIPFLTAIVAFAEDRKWNISRQLIAQAAGMLLLAVYWYFLNVKGKGAEYKELPELLTTLLVAHLAVAVAPYFNKRPVRDFWEYNKQLFANFLIGSAFTFILFAGLSLAILALDQLFGFDIDNTIYPKLFIFLAGVFNTSYFLFHYPKAYNFDSADQSYHFIFRNLCKFILIPIVGLYFVILYAYSLKILITWELPKGWVGSLVTGFSVAGIFTYLLNFYLPEQDDSWIVQAYRRWFWWIVFPMTVLLFVAIGRRVSDYGVTEVRYLVVQLGIWLMLNCLYFLFSKKDNIKIIPISLAVFALGWAYGPFSASAVSERSQIGRLKTILENNGRFEHGKIKPGDTSLTEQEYNNLYGTLEFFDRRGKMYVLDEMMPMPVSNLPNEEGEYGETDKILHWLGVTSPLAESQPATFYLDSENTPANASIVGFSKFYQVNLNRNDTPNSDKDGYYFSLNQTGNYLKWYEMKKTKLDLIDSLSLQTQISKWATKESQNKSPNLSTQESVFDLVSKKGTIRLCITSASIYKDKTVSGFEHIDGFLFVK